VGKEPPCCPLSASRVRLKEERSFFQKYETEKGGEGKTASRSCPRRRRKSSAQAGRSGNSSSYYFRNSHRIKLLKGETESMPSDRRKETVKKDQVVGTCTLRLGISLRAYHRKGGAKGVRKKIMHSDREGGRRNSGQEVNAPGQLLFLRGGEGTGSKPTTHTTQRLAKKKKDPVG